MAFLAFGHIHSAALGMENGRRLQADFERMKRSPSYQEPPPVGGYSFPRLIEDRHNAARERGTAAMLAFGAGLGASLVAGILLWLLRRGPDRA